MHTPDLYLKPCDCPHLLFLCTHTRAFLGTSKELQEGRQEGQQLSWAAGPSVSGQLHVELGWLRAGPTEIV